MVRGMGQWLVAGGGGGGGGVDKTTSLTLFIRINKT